MTAPGFALLHRRTAPLAPLGLALLAWACDGDPPDAYGSFESREVTVSAEQSGTLVRFDLSDGDRVESGAVVAQLDSVPLALQTRELDVQARLALTRGEEARAQLRALEAQLRTVRDDLERTRRLFDNDVATATDLNRLEGSVASLAEQVTAARVRVRLAGQEAEAVETRRAQLEDRLRRTTVRNPAGGTVLTTYAETGEFVQQGRPLYTVAPLDTLILRAYVSGSQLAGLEIGGGVFVQFDGPGGELERREGRIAWVSSVAEFTPTPIQTREERVDQVYAVKVEVPNPDGALKIGMPGELLLVDRGRAGSTP